MTENTVLYRAQVAVEGRTTGNAESEDGTSAHTIGRHTKCADATGRGNQTKHNAVKQSSSADLAMDIVIDNHLRRFSIQRSEDLKRADIRGIVVLSDKIVVSDGDNDKLKLFDMNGKTKGYNLRELPDVKDDHCH